MSDSPERIQSKSPEQNTPRFEQQLGAPSKMTGDLSLEQSIPNFVGASISLPGSWNRDERSIGGPRTLITFSNNNDSATLSLYDRGKDVRASSAKYFNDILSANANLKNPKALNPDEIKNLAEVMGSTTAGDNQYVNPYKQPDPRSPAFDLKSAELVSVNGRTVLEVKGNFFDNTGRPGKEYRGIFVPSGANGASIKEFFLQSQDKASFGKHEKDYEDAVHSIKW